MKNLLQIIVALSTITLLSCDKTEVIETCSFQEDLEGYTLVWSDEFDGTQIDDAKWSFDIGDGCDRGENLCGWGNNELQYYTDREENAGIDNGNLVITAKREFPRIEGASFSSARLVTKNKADWTYGRMDIRAKLPVGQGLWPAIWLLHTDTTYGQWPKSGEIDIMEYIGSEPEKVFGTVHYGHDFWRFSGTDTVLTSGNFHDEFHTFSVLWTETCIQFLLDGKIYGEPKTRSTVLPTTWPFDHDFHMILNVAVGGNLPGNPDSSTEFPQTMEVDYVRVYQQE